MNCEHKWQYFQWHHENFFCFYRRCSLCNRTETRGRSRGEYTWWETHMGYLTAALLSGTAHEIPTEKVIP